MKGPMIVLLLVLPAILLSILLVNLRARRATAVSKKIEPFDTAPRRALSRSYQLNDSAPCYRDKGGRGAWATLRQMIGWGCVVIGLFALVLPGPGIALLIIGVMLVGRRHPLIRRIIVGVKLLLREWARQPGVRGWIGRRGKRLGHVLSTELRHVHARAKG